jgi:hypothetical protein
MSGLISSNRSECGRRWDNCANGVALLHEVANSKRSERPENNDRNQDDFEHLMIEEPEADQQSRQGAQMVRMTSRPENGNSSVSMEASWTVLQLLLRACYSS